MNTAPDTPAPLLAAADAMVPDLLADLRRLVEVESPSADLAAVAEGAAVVADVVEKRLGRRPETIVEQGVTHLLLRLGGPTRVLLLCHQDTVWPVGTLERLPWSHQDGVVRGPGTFDMLTGLVMAVHACALLQESSGPEALDGVTLLVTGDEEVGSEHSRELILQTAQGAAGVLVLEASADGGAVKVARKGASRYRLELKGVAAHAGLDPERGVSALLELASQLPRILELADPEQGTTVTPTTFAGGTTSNTVPAAATLDIDVRAGSAEELERVHTGLHTLRATQEGAQVRTVGEINRYPMERHHSDDLWRRYADVCVSLGLPVPDAAAVGGASDGNFTAAAGIPTLDGLGAVGGGAHAEHEHVLVDQIAPRTAVLARLVEQLRDAASAQGGAAATPGRETD
ncbi:M20/M25/M40 family metallo-hydrolase [uncultured Serinicoccus sp.]|uniref:M20/M25/M40 family metallo-hydrolase n=1 Tax=uncultured Serinicoccus sp. TaxID=735514 RepID=UPI00262F97A2|nr:M20/M25/M40 family metallo-hydrolase [uncultured Serinicoccus sp.]